MSFIKSKGKIIFMIIIAGIISLGVYFVFIGNMTDVLVVNQTIRGGTEITSNMLTVKKADKSSLPDNYVVADYKDKIVGKYFDLGLTKGGVVTKDNLSLTGKASLIKTGKILYAMKDLETYPQGLVTGDKLNIVVATSNGGSKFVKTLENVEVASVHMDEGQVVGVEIYVTPEESQAIAFAQSNGDVSLGLLPLDYQNKNLGILDDGGFISESTQTPTGQTPEAE